MSLRAGCTARGWGFITSHDGLFRASLKFAREYERRADKVKSNNRKLDIVKALMEERRGPGMAGDHVTPAEIVPSGEYWHARNDYLSNGKEK